MLYDVLYDICIYIFLLFCTYILILRSSALGFSLCQLMTLVFGMTFDVILHSIIPDHHAIHVSHLQAMSGVDFHWLFFVQHGSSC